MNATERFYFQDSVFAVKIPIRTVSRSNLRAHWSALHKLDAEHKKLTRAILGTRALGLLPCTVTLTRISPYKLDDDNVRGALKAVRDAVAIALGLPVTRQGIANDRDPRVTWDYDQNRGAPREYAVKIQIEPRHV